MIVNTPAGADCGLSKCEDLFFLTNGDVLLKLFRLSNDTSSLVFVGVLNPSFVAFVGLFTVDRLGGVSLATAISGNDGVCESVDLIGIETPLSIVIVGLDTSTSRLKALVKC